LEEEFVMTLIKGDFCCEVIVSLVLLVSVMNDKNLICGKLTDWSPFSKGMSIMFIPEQSL
jgi:hypothetical protein